MIKKNIHILLLLSLFGCSSYFKNNDYLKRETLDISLDDITHEIIDQKLQNFKIDFHEHYFKMVNCHKDFNKKVSCTYGYLEFGGTIKNKILSYDKDEISVRFYNNEYSFYHKGKYFNDGVYDDYIFNITLSGNNRYIIEKNENNYLVLEFKK